jgi:cell fate regulator YaaT (PSP1 superfamily)
MEPGEVYPLTVRLYPDVERLQAGTPHPRRSLEQQFSPVRREPEHRRAAVDVEHLFGGERIIVYYLAEGRVDFRELVRRLATEFQTRIEMRQIGVRDEAKLLADYGDCGKTVCCNSHLVEMPPVSMKMAKLQKATLDPTKISGRCGRLKCCLRYEYDTYLDLQAALPPVNSEIITPRGVHECLAKKSWLNNCWSRWRITGDW